VLENAGKHGITFKFHIYLYYLTLSGVEYSTFSKKCQAEFFAIHACLIKIPVIRVHRSGIIGQVIKMEKMVQIFSQIKGFRHSGYIKYKLPCLNNIYCTKERSVVS